jgi:hypothetical protein
MTTSDRAENTIYHVIQYVNWKCQTLYGTKLTMSDYR